MNSFSNGNNTFVLREIGSRLKDVRISMNITQIDFANKCGISESTLKRIEAGQDTKFSNVIKVLRYSKLISNLEMLVPKKEPDFKSIYMNQKAKKRVGKRNNNTKQWKWGDED